jgi:hypothetical protein
MVIFFFVFLPPNTEFGSHCNREKKKKTVGYLFCDSLFIYDFTGARFQATGNQD